METIKMVLSGVIGIRRTSFSGNPTNPTSSDS